MLIKEYHKKKMHTASQPEVEEKVKKLRKEHDKMVKGMFEFVDAQGGWLDFTYRWFKDEPIKTIRLIHGEICDLPMGIVKHLNNCYKKIRLPRQGNMDEMQRDGQRGMPMEVTKVSRIRFTPMDML